MIQAAKTLSRRVIVHLHDYQPISHTVVIFHNEDFKSDLMQTFYYEFHEHSLTRALVTVPFINKKLTDENSYST
jgi:hypothetical protein